MAIMLNHFTYVLEKEKQKSNGFKIRLVVVAVFRFGGLR
jgi:hypothetical protein